MDNIEHTLLLAHGQYLPEQRLGPAAHRGGRGDGRG